jgi:hypothetical protein
VIHSPPEEVYSRGFTYRIAALLLALLVVAGLFYFRSRLPREWSWGLGALAALSLILYWKREAGKVVEIHPEGMVVRSGSSARAMQWESVRQVRYRAIVSRGGGVLGVLFRALLHGFSRRSTGVDERSVSIRCALLADSQPPLVLTSGWSRAGDAVEKILARVNPRLLQEALDLVRTSGRAEFGPLAIQHDAILRGRKSVRFAEVASFGLESGRFFVKKQGAWLNVIQMPVAKIPNAFVLVELLRQLGVPGMRPGTLASANSSG